jgi:ribosomal protein L21E
MKGKKIRNKGKVKISGYFKKVSDGDRVAIISELGVSSSFPKRLQGRGGVVIGTRGNFKLVEIKEGGKIKKYIVHPVHLKKL